MIKTASRKATTHHHLAKPHHKHAVHVKYPKDGEKVSRPDYTVQIEASPEPVRVELRINNSNWVPCREALGLYWFDWTGFEPGEHSLIARMMTPDGDTVESVEREIIVL